MRWCDDCKQYVSAGFALRDCIKKQHKIVWEKERTTR